MDYNKWIDQQLFFIIFHQFKCLLSSLIKSLGITCSVIVKFKFKIIWFNVKRIEIQSQIRIRNLMRRYARVYTLCPFESSGWPDVLYFKRENSVFNFKTILLSRRVFTVTLQCFEFKKLYLIHTKYSLIFAKFK